MQQRGICMVVLLMLLLCLSAAVAWAEADSDSPPGPVEAPPPPEPVPEYRCEDIGQVPLDQQCAFVMQECEDESRLPYTRWYFCDVKPHGILAQSAFMVLLMLLLPLLFTALGDTAELYFSPTMAIIAQTIPGMRPRFAGVTFVAVGNGAPDLSANISALRTGRVALSVGAFTGAAMFVQCVVASEVIRISGGVKCRGAMLRDVGVYAVCVLGVGLSLHSGLVTRWFVAGAALAYVAYAAWVFAGDEWHARGRPNVSSGLGMAWADLRAILLERQFHQKYGGGGGAADGEPGPHFYTPIMEAVVGGGAAASGGVQGVAGLSEPLLPWAPVEDAAPAAGPQGLDGALQFGEVDGAPSHRVSAAGAKSMASSVLSPGVAVGTPGGPLHSAFGGGPLPQPGPFDSGDLPMAVAVALSHANNGVLPSRLYRQAVWADLSWEPSQARQQLAVELREGLAVGAPSTQGSYALPSSGCRHTTLAPGSSHQPLLQGWSSGAVPGVKSRGGMRSNWSGQAWSADTHATIFQGRGTFDSSRLPAASHPPSQALSLQSSLQLGGAGVSGVGGASGPVSTSRRSSLDGQPASMHTPSQAPRSIADGTTPQAGMLLPPNILEVSSEARTPLPGAGPQSEALGATPRPATPRRWSKEWWGRAWEQVCLELTFGTSSEWAELPGWRRRIRVASFTTLLPLYLCLRLGVPLADPETYSQRWLVVSMLCSPLMVTVYLGAQSLGAVLTAVAVGAVLAGAVHLLTCDEMELPPLNCGTSFAFGPALVSLCGFVMGVLWIDTLASEVVGVTSLLSGLLQLPPSLVGLTLLAWGNSLGDFFGNQAMARRGASSTALTACFAAPLFNMLLSMALGFSAYFAKEGVTSAAVSLPYDTVLGVGALVLYNAVLVAVGLANRFFIPERFYLFARAWYCVYLAAAAAVALSTG